MRVEFLDDEMVLINNTQAKLTWHTSPTLPLYDTPIPRQPLVAAIAAQLRTHGQVTLVGMPGSGKSTLATLVAHHTQADYPAGVVYEHIGEVYDADAAQFTLGEWLLKAIDLPQIPLGCTPEPQVIQAVKVLRQMYAQSNPTTFAQRWTQVLGIALPDWGKW